MVARKFIALSLLGALTISLNSALAAEKKMPVLPVSSKGTLKADSFKSLDQLMLKMMREYHIYAGQLAVSKNGVVAYSRAFGFSDKDHKVPTTTESKFRIASSSKPVTAVAIMNLIQQGRLNIEDKALDILSDYRPAPGQPFDQRLNTITIRQLLEHNAGFSNEKCDPQFDYLRVAAQKYNLAQPASPQAIVRYRLTLPLDRDPATKYEYSNFGYNMLGRIIEKVSGENYEAYVKKNVLDPAGSHMQIGHTRPSQQFEGEVYYDDQTGDQHWSVFDAEPEQVAMSYGSAFSQEAMDSHGGWVTTAEDMVKFVAFTDGSGKTRLLDVKTVELMLSPPAVQQNSKENGAGKGGSASKGFYAKGWNVKPASDTWCHSGALTYGTASFICHLKDGVQVACVFNHLPLNLAKFFGGLEKTVVNAVEKERKNL